MGLDKYRIYTDYDSNIIVHHRKVLLSDEGSNKVSKTDLDMDSKPNPDMNQCSKYLFNDKLNLNRNTPSYHFACRDYVRPK